MEKCFQKSQPNVKTTIVLIHFVMKARLEKISIQSLILKFTTKYEISMPRVKESYPSELLYLRKLRTSKCDFYQ